MRAGRSGGGSQRIGQEIRVPEERPGGMGGREKAAEARSGALSGYTTF